MKLLESFKVAEEGGSTRPIASPIINTSVWSAIVCGFVRKKKASVTWKSDRDVMIVAAEITAILKLCLLNSRTARVSSFFCREVSWWLYRLEGKPRVSCTKL